MSQKPRIFAILNIHKDVDIRTNIVEKIPDGSKVVIFQKNEVVPFEIPGKVLEFVKIPEEISDKISKMRNFIIKTVKSSNFGGFLHISEDNVVLKSDPTAFFADVELLMETFGMKSWFNTALDGCNYVLTRYNPRFSVDVDVENVPFSGKTVHWCSNANTEWTVFDLECATDDDMMLREEFGISMYYIIEFLARRRNRKSPGELYYMNMYPGVDSELGVLGQAEVKDDSISQDRFKAEDAIFKEMRVDNHPDMDRDAIMSDMVGKMKI